MDGLDADFFAFNYATDREDFSPYAGPSTLRSVPPSAREPKPSNSEPLLSKFFSKSSHRACFCVVTLVSLITGCVIGCLVMYAVVGKTVYIIETSDDESKCETQRRIIPRRTNISDLGEPDLFRGWVDVQGQGAANDYCRVVSKGKARFLSCALAGSTTDHQYTSPHPSTDWFDAGYMNTWYMTDKDYDGRDDYCRCVGEAPDTVVNCMKAGVTGFVSLYDFKIPGTAGCHRDSVNPFFGIH